MAVIAIDFDNTFTADVDLFTAFVSFAHKRGHTCVLVTGRSDDGRWGDEVREAVGLLMPIVFAGRMWKAEAAKAAGFAVDIWIDDHPEAIAEQVLIGRT